MFYFYKKELLRDENTTIYYFANRCKYNLKCELASAISGLRLELY